MRSANGKSNCGGGATRLRNCVQSLLLRSKLYDEVRTQPNKRRFLQINRDLSAPRDQCAHRRAQVINLQWFNNLYTPTQGCLITSPKLHFNKGEDDRGDDLVLRHINLVLSISP